MLYTLCLHLHGPLFTTLLTVTAACLLIFIVKEKRDERKRA